MEKDFNLSDKIEEGDNLYRTPESLIETKDVKEFIKELKEKCGVCNGKGVYTEYDYYSKDEENECWNCWTIDKLAGDKLK